MPDAKSISVAVATEGFFSAGLVMPEARAFANSLGALPAYQCHSEHAAIAEGLPLLEPAALDSHSPYACYRLRDYINHPALLGLLFNEDLHAIADDYLGENHLAAVTCWKTLADPKGGAVQKFHRDGYEGRSLALFIYLNDVSTENGPHVYVRRSHTFATFAQELSAIDHISDEKRAEILHNSFVANGNNYPLNETIENVAPHLMHTHIGGAGSGVFTEPRGIHRGDAVLSDYRLMLSLRWGPNPAPAPRGDDLAASLRPAIRGPHGERIVENLQASYDYLYHSEPNSEPKHSEPSHSEPAPPSLSQPIANVIDRPPSFAIQTFRKLPTFIRKPIRDLFYLFKP